MKDNKQIKDNAKAIEEYKEEHDTFLENEVTCPYCGHEQNQSADDGYCYEEAGALDYTCEECDRDFIIKPELKWEFSTLCLVSEIVTILKDEEENEN